MWQLLIFAVIMAALAVLVTVITREQGHKSRENQICPSCGKKACTCHKNTDS